MSREDRIKAYREAIAELASRGKRSAILEWLLETEPADDNGEERQCLLPVSRVKSTE